MNGKVHVKVVLRDGKCIVTNNVNNIIHLFFNSKQLRAYLQDEYGVATHRMMPILIENKVYEFDHYPAAA